MKNNGLHDLLVYELKDIYSAERQIINYLPKLIALASLPELKEMLSKHLNETEDHMKRLDRIFSILSLQPSDVVCQAMRGLIQETNELVEGAVQSAILDASIICAIQKIEHYGIASYGTLRSFAKQLELDSEIIDLLQESLDEEGEANKKLTKIAEGSFFSSGVNEGAAACGNHEGSC